MKKATIFQKERTTLELAAIFVFALVMVANLVVVRFAEGYFGYYDISLAQVNYAPQMYDYVRIALPIIISASVVTAAVFGLMRLSIYIGSLLAESAKPSKRAIKYVRRYEKFFKRLIIIFSLLIRAGVWGAAIWVLWSVLYSVAADMGRVYAENAMKVSSISSTGDILQKVIIYKGENELILKEYDTSKKEFLDGYSVLYGTSYTTKTISL